MEFYSHYILLKPPELNHKQWFRILLLKVRELCVKLYRPFPQYQNLVFPTFTMTFVRYDTPQEGNRGFCSCRCNFPTLLSLCTSVLFHKHTQTGRAKHLAPYSSSVSTPQSQPSLSIPSLISNRVNKTTAANRSAKQRMPSPSPSHPSVSSSNHGSVREGTDITPLDEHYATRTFHITISVLQRLSVSSGG
jgi:hypothetical protein